MAKLTDRQRKQVVADYVRLESYSEVGRIHGLSVPGVKKIVDKDKAGLERLRAKKEQNTLDMLEYIDSKKGEAQKIVSQILHNLYDSERLKEASPREQATVMAIVIDKFLLPNTLRQNNAENKEDKVQVNIHFKDLSGEVDGS